MKNMKLKALLLTVAMTATLTACGKANVQLNNEGAVTLELGTEVSADLSTYVTVDDPEALNDMTLDTSNVNTDVVGDYTATVTYKKDVFTFKVSVVDTTAPEVEVAGNKEVLVGDTLKAADVAKATDLTDVTVTFEDGTDTWVAKEAGDVTLTVVAVDANGNEAKETVTVKVVEPEPVEVENVEADEVEDEEPQIVTGKTDKKDKEVKEEATDEVVTGTTGTTNAGTTNSGTVAQTPAPAPAPVPAPAPTPTPTPSTPTTPSTPSGGGDSGSGSTSSYDSYFDPSNPYSSGVDQKIEDGIKPDPSDYL